MIRGYISNPKQLSKEMQLRIASMAEKQVRIAELGFPLNEKKLVQTNTRTNFNSSTRSLRIAF
jgi:hypothetical protein